MAIFLVLQSGLYWLVLWPTNSPFKDHGTPFNKVYKGQFQFRKISVKHTVYLAI